MINLLVAKKATNKEILDFLNESRDRKIISMSRVEIENWLTIEKEARKRKIAMHDNCVRTRRNWE